MHATTRRTPAAMSGIGARPGAALMRARFEIDVNSCAAGFVAGLLEGEDFSVLDAFKGVRAFADHPCLRRSTTTAPTHGLGEVKPILFRASSSARRRKYSSFSRLDEMAGRPAGEDFRGAFRLSRFNRFLGSQYGEMILASDKV